MTDAPAFVREVRENLLGAATLCKAGQDGSDSYPRTLDDRLAPADMRIGDDEILVVHNALLAAAIREPESAVVATF